MGGCEGSGEGKGEVAMEQGGLGEGDESWDLGGWELGMVLEEKPGENDISVGEGLLARILGV